MPDDTPTTSEGASQWMKDVNETLDLLGDETTDLKKQLKTHMLGIGIIGGIAGLEALGIATLFKTQQSIVATLQQIVNAIPVGPPPTPEDIYRYEQTMAQARREAATAPIVMEPVPTTTEVPSDVAPPVETAASEAPEWAKHAMADDPDWTSLTGEDGLS